MTPAPTRQTVRIDGVDHPFVDPEAIPRAELDWLEEIGGMPLRTSATRRILRLPGHRLDREFRAASKTPNFKLRKAIASVQCGLIDAATWKCEGSPSGALRRVVRILLPDAPPAAITRMSDRQAEALAEAFMDSGGVAQ